MLKEAKRHGTCALDASRQRAAFDWTAFFREEFRDLLDARFACIKPYDVVMESKEPRVIQDYGQDELDATPLLLLARASQPDAR